MHDCSLLGTLSYKNKCFSSSSDFNKNGDKGPLIIFYFSLNFRKCVIFNSFMVSSLFLKVCTRTFVFLHFESINNKEIHASSKK